jgi:16S rRNA (uracil1498-N3)-methyltransferase
MHRFFLPPAQCQRRPLVLEGREAHHALHVLRLERGDPLTVLDGAGAVLLCEVESIGRDTLTLALREAQSRPAPPCSLTLLVGVPKGKIIEDIIQKAAELGAQRIVPLLTERTVMQLDPPAAEARRKKWQQVAVEAIKQCGAAWLPEVARPQSVPDFLAGSDRMELPFVGSLQTERRHPRAWLEEFTRTQHRLPRSAGIWIGPEGDFTPWELKAIEDSGARPVTFGELTLRVETAAIYGLAFLNYELRLTPPAAA